MTETMRQVGPFDVVRELTRAPGQILAEGRDLDGTRRLLQMIPLATIDGSKAQAHARLVKRASELTTEVMTTQAVVAHGVAEMPGLGSDLRRVLYWALPWPNGALQALKPPLSADALRRVATQAATALAERHAAGQTHGLLSQAAVWADDGAETVKILGVPMVVGLAWIAPEVPLPPLAPGEAWDRPVTPAGDMWRFGCVLRDLGGPTKLPDDLRDLIADLTSAAPAARPDVAATLRRLRGESADDVSATLSGRSMLLRSAGRPREPDTDPSMTGAPEDSSRPDTPAGGASDGRAARHQGDVAGRRSSSSSAVSGTALADLDPGASDDAASSSPDAADPWTVSTQRSRIDSPSVVAATAQAIDVGAVSDPQTPAEVDDAQVLAAAIDEAAEFTQSTEALVEALVVAAEADAPTAVAPESGADGVPSLPASGVSVRSTGADSTLAVADLAETSDPPRRAAASAVSAVGVERDSTTDPMHLPVDADMGRATEGSTSDDGRPRSPTRALQVAGAEAGAGARHVRRPETRPIVGGPALATRKSIAAAATDPMAPLPVDVSRSAFGDEGAWMADTEPPDPEAWMAEEASGHDPAEPFASVTEPADRSAWDMAVAAARADAAAHDREVAMDPRNAVAGGPSTESAGPSGPVAAATFADGGPVAAATSADGGPAAATFSDHGLAAAATSGGGPGGTDTLSESAERLSQVAIEGAAGTGIGFESIESMVDVDGGAADDLPELSSSDIESIDASAETPVFEPPIASDDATVEPVVDLPVTYLSSTDTSDEHRALRAFGGEAELPAEAPEPKRNEPRAPRGESGPAQIIQTPKAETSASAGGRLPSPSRRTPADKRQPDAQIVARAQAKTERAVSQPAPHFSPTHARTEMPTGRSAAGSAAGPAAGPAGRSADAVSAQSSSGRARPAVAERATGASSKAGVRQGDVPTHVLNRVRRSIFKRVPMTRWVAGVVVLLVIGGAIMILRPAPAPSVPLPIMTVRGDLAVSLTSEPVGAEVIAESDGRLLGRTPMTVMVPTGSQMVVLLDAPDRTPMRIVLPEHGDLHATLPRSSGTGCTVQVETDPGVTLQEHRGTQSVPGLVSVAQAAIFRREGAGRRVGARLVRCPHDPSEAVAVQLSAGRRRRVRLNGPAGLVMTLNGVPLTTPADTHVERAFAELRLEYPDGRRQVRWVGLGADTVVNVPALAPLRAAASANVDGAPKPKRRSTEIRRARRAAIKHYRRARKALAAGRNSSARKSFRRCIKADGAYAECHRGLGLAYRRLKQLDRAQEHYRRYLELRPNAKDADKIRRLLGDSSSTGAAE